MLKGKSSFIIALGLAIAIASVTGCAGKKKPPQQQAAPAQKAPETKPAPAPKIQEPARRVEEKESVPSNLTLETIYFDFDKSDIRADQRSAINRNAELLTKYPSVKVQVEGHCDERGTNAYNISLGQRRADATKQFLVEYGISSSRITTVSYGEERPVDMGHSESAWAKNRRTEFIITGK